jgi:hypothetical protein
VLKDRLTGLTPEARAPLDQELALLLRRRHLVNMAITSGTCAALMVAGVIASAFLGFLLGWKVAWAMAVLFILAMLFVMGALLLFLREVLIAAIAVAPRTARPDGS